MTAKLEWTTGTTQLTCRVCDYAGKGLRVCRVSRRGQPTLDCVRCPKCASIDVQGCAAFDYTLTEDTVDPFIENGLSVDAAFDVLHIATLAHVDRFLDVGCNYGFAVDIASRVFGWQSMGIEPGAAGRRGKAELGASIVDGYLTEQTVLGDPFDLILASEVLEHVSEPVSFLRAILQNLAPEGRAVFTTPAAEAIDPVNEPEAVLVALSPGFHVFLASAEGVATLFRAAGFESFEVERRLDTLWIIAAREPKRTLEFPKAVANPEVLETYLDDRSRTAAPGSALASGMASRHFRSLANRGDFANAVQSRERAIDAIATRHGVDAHDPLKAISTLAAGGSAPWNLASVAYSCAMMELIHEHNPKRALDYFDLTIAATDAWSVHAVVIDADSRDLRANALRHRVRALAALGSPEVPAALESLRLPELENARESVHAFVVSVARGHLELARELQEIVIRSAPQFATTTSPHDLTLGFDGLLSLALLDLQSAEDARALRWTSLALSLLDSIPAEHTWEQMTTPMRVNLENSAAVALSRLEGTESALAAPVEPLSSFIPGTVSVIMPVYNGQAHLQTALRSVIDQDEQPLELIIIDDGSTDSSVDIIRTIEFPFPITIIRQANSGQSAARNAGGRAAQGEFLAFIDQDDQWREDHLSILHPAIELDKNLAWVFSDFDQVDSNGQTVTTHFVAEVGVQHPKRSLISVIAGDLMALPSASIMRRSAVFAVGGFDPRLSGYEDDDLFVRLFRTGWKHAFVPLSTVRYRVHAAGSSSSPGFIQSRLRFMEKLLTSIPDDHRLNYFYSQDVIVPRFLNSTLSDYAGSLAARDYPRALEIVGALRTLSRMQGATGMRRRLQLSALGHPRRMRAILLAIEALPRPFRPRVNPALFFGRRSIVRAQRFHPDKPVSERPIS